MQPEQASTVIRHKNERMVFIPDNFAGRMPAEMV
jgi:hypothetical protein